jgi:hypothetical protein
MKACHRDYRAAEQDYRAEAPSGWVCIFSKRHRLAAVQKSCSVTRLSLLLLPLLLLFFRLLLILLLPLHLLCLHVLLHALMILLHHLALIVDLVTHKIQPGPLVQPILDIADPLWIEHVTGWFERRATSRGIDAFDEGWEKEDHVAAFVHDRGAAEGAGDFTGKLVLDGVLR